MGNNNFCHVELNTTDVSKAEGFYSQLFDWKIASTRAWNTWASAPARRKAGAASRRSRCRKRRTSWLPYVQVKDVKATIAQAQQLGAQIVVPFMEIPDNGAIGVFIDPTGAGLGVYQPAPKAAASKKKPAPKKKVAAKKKKR